MKGVKARGNIEVDLDWKDGMVTRWRLSTAERKPCKVKVKVNGEYFDVMPERK